MQISRIGKLVRHDPDGFKAHYQGTKGEFLICLKFVKNALKRSPKKVKFTVSDRKLAGEHVVALQFGRTCAHFTGWRLAGTGEDFDSNLSNFADKAISDMLGERRIMNTWLRIQILEA